MNQLLLDFVNRCAVLGADPDQVAAMLDADKEAYDAYTFELHELNRRAVHTLAGPVYRVPLLAPVECDFMLNAAAGYDYTPNPEEDKDYQIEEAMLAYVDPEMYEYLKGHLLPILNAYSLFLYSTPITKVESFQIAKYRQGHTPGTGWHADRVSDVTAVISLNPKGFKGGGTGVRVSPDELYELKPLPKGHALLFNGKMIQHRGLDVTEGERLLLVCWCSIQAD